MRDIVLDGKDEFDFFLGEVSVRASAVIHFGHGQLLDYPTQIQSTSPISSKISQENRVVQGDRQTCTVTRIQVAHSLLECFVISVCGSLQEHLTVSLQLFLNICQLIS